jgi:EF hand
MKRCRSLLAALVLAAATPAWAAEELAPQDRPEAFRKLDADGDGWISRKEAAAQPEVAANFDEADRDRDGRLSLAEFETVALNRGDQPGRFRNPDRG